MTKPRILTPFPEAMLRPFSSWLSGQSFFLAGRVFDPPGKTLGSFDAFADRKAAHMMSALRHVDKIILAHVMVAEKSNEIPAAPELGIVPRSVELYEASAAVNDVKRPSRFEQQRGCLFPFRSEQQARLVGPEVA
jgi:hypothetical protein